MKIRAIVVLAVFVLAAGNGYAANGDLTVGGQLSVGAGGIKFLGDNTTQTTATSPTIINDVTASRILGTVYGNPYGKPMFCSVIVSLSVLNYDVYAVTGTTIVPTTLVSKVHLIWSANSTQTLSFWVLPGHFYQVVAGSSNVSLVKWIEWH